MASYGIQLLVGGEGYEFLYPKPKPMGVRNGSVATDKGLIIKDDKIISVTVRTIEE